MITLTPVQVATVEQGAGYLVFSAGRLVAVIVELSPLHKAQAGYWYVEAQFGALDGPPPPPFATLDDVKAWVERRLKG